VSVCGRPKPDGQLCGWKLNGRECPYHGDHATPEGRRLLARKGGYLSRMSRALPASTPEPPFDTVDNVIAWSQRMARTALVEDVDPRRLAEARGFAQLALSAHSARTQAQLVDALLRLEHGGGSVALLAQFVNSDPSKRKPLPGRVLPLPTPETPA
jgi:hypothetical protein